MTPNIGQPHQEQAKKPELLYPSVFIRRTNVEAMEIAWSTGPIEYEMKAILVVKSYQEFIYITYTLQLTILIIASGHVPFSLWTPGPLLCQNVS